MNQTNGCHCEIPSKQRLPIFSNEQGSTISKRQLSLRTSAASEAICQALAVVVKQEAGCENWADCFVVPPRNDSFGLAKAVQWLKIVLK